MDRITLNIDGSDIVVDGGTSILEAALKNGIYIPHLCYHPDLAPSGACRLCWVEVGDGELMISCRTPVEQGMVVKTKTPEVDKVRRPIIEALIAHHHADCRGCVSSGQCELQRIMAYLRVDRKRLRRLRLPKKEMPRDTSNPFFDYDPNKCVLCGICVRTCEEIEYANAINFVGRGYATKIAPFGDKPLAESGCQSCGECVVRCPVGALAPKKFQRRQREVRTVCPYCSVGCSLYLGIRGDAIVNVRGDEDSPVNRGNLCVWGRFGWSFVHSQERLTSPLIKRNGKFVTTSWDEALRLAAEGLARYRGDQCALLASTKCTNEENYVFQKFARVVLGTNNIDNPARLCHTPSMIALREMTGIGAATNPIAELEKAACIMAIGTNVTASHPIVALHVKRALRNGAKLIIINPREIDLCRLPNIWLRPYPGTDVALLMGMSRLIVEEGLIDTAFVEERCENFQELMRALDSFPLGRVERITGISGEMIAKAARVYATSKPAAVLCSAGLTQHSHGTDNVIALVNLALLTANIGKPSSGIYSLSGQNNTQGACDMGCLPDLYPGYHGVADSEVRRKLEAAWGVILNPKPGLTLAELWQAVLDESIKAIYIIGSDPASTVAGSQKVREALERAEFVVIQDMFLNEAAKFADIVLPAASFAEKEGTFTNMERRIQRVRQAIEPVGNSRPDWQIICELAKRLDARGFDFSCPEEIMSEITSVATIYSGIGYSRLEERSLQWPCPDMASPGTSILHVGQFHTPNGRGRLAPLEHRRSEEAPDVDYPLILTNERSPYRYGVLSQRVNGLNALGSKDVIEINAKDAADFGIRDGTLLRVISRRGEIEGQAKVTDTSPPGVISTGTHFIESPINVLTNSALDPVAKTPETRVCAVRVVPLSGRVR
jgi:formate dehydrogenase alpha subunit